ncbi:RloB domain-containing protein [Streptomyces sp. NPDC059452]|uniref:RloB domain-containing protein n=1 Tax=Streptomyces sp. NPDC059452 TaxID=3346835 RepID=UPI003688A7C1
MKRGKPLKRTKGVRPEQRRFLIYCEGERTEDQYFKGVRADLRTLPVSICLGGEHGEPQSLVRAAIEHKERAPNSPQDRAEALRQQATKGHRHNPWTDVDRLVGLLKAARHP